jgi:DNA topoisomerase VI subunit A
VPRPPTPDAEDGLAGKVIHLLETYYIQLNPKQSRKLQVLIDDYIDDMETELSLLKDQLETRQEDDDGYVVD